MLSPQAWWRRRLWIRSATKLGLVHQRRLSRLVGHHHSQLVEVLVGHAPVVRVGPTPSDVVLRGESARRAVPDIYLGSEEFDDAVWVLGNETRLFASLSPATRTDVVLGIERFHMTAERGAVWLWDPPVCDHHDVEQALELACRVAEALAIPHHELPARLLDRVESEPVSMVRIRALETLLQGDPEHWAVVEGARRGLLVPELDTRIRAACLLGEEGVQTLVAVVRGQNIPPRFQYRALRHLVEHHLSPLVAALLVEGIQGGDHALRLAAIRCAGHGAVEATLPYLTHLLQAELEQIESSQDQVWEVSVLVCEAFAEMPLAWREVELPLHKALDCPSVSVQEAAVMALGQIGSPRCRRWVRRKAALSQPRRLRRAVWLALRQLDSRFGRPEQGQLEVALDDQPINGRLSPSAPPGALSELR